MFNQEDIQFTVTTNFHDKPLVRLTYKQGTSEQQVVECQDSYLQTHNKRRALQLLKQLLAQ